MAQQSVGLGGKEKTAANLPHWHPHSSNSPRLKSLKYRRYLPRIVVLSLTPQLFFFAAFIIVNTATSSRHKTQSHPYINPIVGCGFMFCHTALRPTVSDFPKWKAPVAFSQLFKTSRTAKHYCNPVITYQMQYSPSVGIGGLNGT